ncbi:PEP-CTERM sorting domain-containing protein [Lusitaniella coriacea]|uniref:PEP-CTERM sorting domain-containing protein n=1 Tax=Lusitaniella coriacea TaxID=1983105 RepID=UPI003CEB74E7
MPVITRKKPLISVAGVALLAIGIGTQPASAAILTFTGQDVGATPADPRPNSDVAAANFDTAAGVLGAVNVIDFEDAPLGNFAALNIAPGVTATLTGTDTEGGIVTTPTLFGGTTPNTLGYNTTSGGEKFLGVVPVHDIGTMSVDFSFAEPIQAFGSYLTGLGTANGDLNVLFDDGTSQMLSVVGDSSGGSLFFGFTDAGKSIASVSLRLTSVMGSRDIFAIDDVRFVAASSPSSSVPEPSSMLGILGIGTAVAALALKRKGERF